MDIQVKDINYNQEKGTLSASLYVEGQKAANIVNNQLHGLRPHEYEYYGDEGKVLTGLANAYLKNGPPLKVETRDAIITVPNSLYKFILKSVLDHAEQRLQAETSQHAWEVVKGQLSKKGILFGSEDANAPLHLLQPPEPLEQMLADPAKRAGIIQKIQTEIFPNLQPGDRILNTNLPKDFIDELYKGQNKGVAIDETDKSQAQHGTQDLGEEDSTTLSKGRRMG